MELARAKGPLVMLNWMAGGPGSADVARHFYILLAFLTAFQWNQSIKHYSSKKTTSFPGSSLYLEKIPWLWLVTCLLNRRPVSLVGRAPDCCAGGRRFKPRPVIQG